MLSEVVPQVAALLEYGATAGVPALKVEFDTGCVGIAHSYGLVPVLGDSLKCLGRWKSLEGACHL